MWCKAWKDGAEVTVKLTPRASKNAILGAEETWLRVALSAPPVDGKANEAARVFLAEALDIPKSRVALLSGQTSRLKRFALAGITPEEVRTRLAP